MNQEDIFKTLSRSFEDFFLSSQEKHEVRALAEVLIDDPTHLNYVRNQAFEIYHQSLLAQPEKASDGLKWLQGILKSLDTVRNQQLVQSEAYFSPGSECRDAIIKQIRAARNSIDVCVFTISDDRITEALMGAFKKQLKLRILSDNDKADDRGSDIYRLAKAGVPVKLDTSPNHMHHKYAIFDNRYLLNGSFNWTRSASSVNQENITITQEQSLIAAFNKSFEQLWKSSKKIH